MVYNQTLFGTFVVFLGSLEGLAVREVVTTLGQARFGFELQLTANTLTHIFSAEARW
jgi:hypothetical protein